jgi:hypothetical protein
MRKSWGWALVLVLGWSTPVSAQTFGVTLNLNQDAANTAAQLGISVSELETEIQQQVEALYGIADIEEFLELSANAQGLTSKGLGLDYASDRRGWIFGLAVSAALDAGDSDLADIENLDLTSFDRAIPLGLGAQIGLMTGYNFRRQGLPRLTLYINGLYTEYSVQEFTGRFINFGFHGQYKLVKSVGSDLASWGGIDISTGIDLSRLVLTLQDTLTTSTPITEGDVTVILETAGTGAVRVRQSAWSIPFEATTSVKLLYFLGLYGGIATDLVFGSARLEADVETPLFADGTEIGTAEIFADESNGPSTAIFRLLGGVQFHIWKFKLFGQINLLTENLAVAGAAGLRFVE